jgi:formate/nitrite transporter FocA (FNT family)
MTEHSFNMDAYVPAEMATPVETVGVAKAHLDTATMFALAVLAGAFLALGANVATMP